MKNMQIFGINSHGEHIEIATAEVPDDYKVPAREVQEINADDEDNGLCVHDGDKVFMGVMGSGDTESSVFWVEDAKGDLTTFRRYQHLKFWLADRMFPQEG